MRQYKSENFVNIFERVENVRIRLNLTWDEMAKKLGVDRSFFFHLKAGRRGFSSKVIYKLEQAESEAGIYVAVKSQPMIARETVEPFGARNLNKSDLRKMLADVEKMRDKLKSMLGDD